MSDKYSANCTYGHNGYENLPDLKFVIEEISKELFPLVSEMLANTIVISFLKLDCG